MVMVITAELKPYMNTGFKTNKKKKQCAIAELGIKL